MMTETLTNGLDLFISYAHADDRGENAGKVAALVGAIEAEYLRVTGGVLNVFFDTHAIRSMDDWLARILTGLRQSKMMVAVLSPSYFQSDYCRREWEFYVETELAHALPGNGIAPIYVVKHPAFEADPVEEKLEIWIKDLRRRQYIEWLPFWPEGAHALEREDVRRRLAVLPAQIAERLSRAAARDASPNTVPLPSVHFVGRRDEMHALLNDLISGQIGAITAVHGIPGIGKSMLAFAYAWGFGFKYPGGRFLINAANLADLAAGVIALAEPKGVALGDSERNHPEIALAKVKAALESGPPALIVIDNVDDPALLTPRACERALPKGDHIHVLVTTRISPDDLPRMRCLALDSLEPQDALALLQGFRPIADSPQDDEWKAALEIVRRLGGHALAVEVVAVFLREHDGVSYREFAESLERDGISVMEAVGPEAKGRLAWHDESSMARLLEPTLAALAPSALRAVEYAAFLPPDNVPLPWLRDLLLGDFPELSRAGLGEPLAELFKRLERLRLVVPHVQRRGLTGGASPGDERLARMHRLVQDVVRKRADEGAGPLRKQLVYGHASKRGDWVKSHWGQPGLAWELLPLRDLALRRIDEGGLDGYLLAVAITTPLLHTGRTLDARELWRRSAAMFQRLADDAPDDAVYARGLSVSYERLGDLARSGGDTAGARRFYEYGLKIGMRLADAAPENTDYARGLSVSYERLGDLAKSGGDSDAARRFYEDGLKIRTRLADAAPENADYARDLSVSYNKMGDLARSCGDPDAARRFYEDGLKIAKRLADAAPEHADYARDLSISYDRLGDLALSGGDPADARRFYEDGLKIRARLAHAAPENADYARGLSVSFERLGDLARSGGDPDAARRFYEDGLKIANRLADAAPENADYARDLWVSHWKMATLAEKHPETDYAAVWRRRAYDVLLMMKRKGWFISPEDEGCLRQLEEKLGLS
jgi:tetratricopeptide (TPR) repeat protein